MRRLRLAKLRLAQSSPAAERLPGPAPMEVATEPARDADEVLSPVPFRDPADFAPIPPPKARLADLLELAGHILFVLALTVALPLAVLWAGFRLYRWLPFETMAFAVVSMAALWAYRDRLLPVLKALLLGRGS